jgi:tricorn protease
VPIPTPGYYHHPTIHEETIVFVSEYDLWSVSVQGGTARKLTCGLGPVSFPSLSPDGEWIAFTAGSDGPNEVYVMPSRGGPTRRLTHLGANSLVIGWTPESEVVFRTDGGTVFAAAASLQAVPLDEAVIRTLPTGPAEFISFGAAGGFVVARPAVNAARWKRYRGGASGNIWIDEYGRGRFRLVKLPNGNPCRPLWIGDRIYFTSDHEGIGNLYSCELDGSRVRRQTSHNKYCVRGATSSGKRIVYQCGANLFVFETASGDNYQVRVEYQSARLQKRTRLIDASKHVEAYAPSTGGEAIIIIVRGRAFVMRTNHGVVREVAAKPYGRLGAPVWLHDGRKFAIVSDASGEEMIEVHDWLNKRPVTYLKTASIGRVTAVCASPVSDHIVLTNHRHELILVDLIRKRSRVLDRPRPAPVAGFDISPDGRWIAYGCPITPYTSIIKLCRMSDGATFPVTRPVLRDTSPSFDPSGRFLHFLSYRVFDPVLDNIQSGVSFPCGMRPYFLPLRTEFGSPFQDCSEMTSVRPARHLEPDLKGIFDRVIALPVPESIYLRIDGVRGGLMILSKPPQGSLRHTWIPQHDPVTNATLSLYSFSARRLQTLSGSIRDYSISIDRSALVYRTAEGRLAALTEADWSARAPGTKRPQEPKTWIDLGRIRARLDPHAEWSQSYRESWRLQRDHFLTGGPKWQRWWAEQYDKYLPLLRRVNTREELTDLLYELLSEICTSHADVFGGDFPEKRRHNMGYLGADLRFDCTHWRIARIIRGDSWDETARSPLAAPGLDIREDTIILAINGQRVNRGTPPQALLIDQAGFPVELTLAEGKRRRVIEIVPIASERKLRYREWVERACAAVHQATQNHCGYVHIPNMASQGCSEFFRYYLAELEHDALIIDVRFNEGGYLHEAILEKMAHRLGWLRFRWSSERPYPSISAKKPVIVLINEYCQSAGEVFAQSLRSLGFGPLIGTRTWGGIVGFWPRQYLSDGGLTTQPELETIFTAQPRSIENHGVEPDIHVDSGPEDYILGRDSQLAYAITVAKKKLGVERSKHIATRSAYD